MIQRIKVLSTEFIDEYQAVVRSMPDSADRSASVAKLNALKGMREQQIPCTQNIAHESGIWMRLRQSCSPCICIFTRPRAIAKWNDYDT